MLGEPLSGVILAALFLGQVITPTELVGGGLVLVAVLFVQRPSVPVPLVPGHPTA